MWIWITLAGWASTDIGFAALMGVIIGVLIMLVRIVTPTASHRFYKRQQKKTENDEDEKD